MIMSRNMVNLAEEEIIPQKIPVREVEIRNIVRKLLENLSAKQKLVIASRFGVENGSAKTLEAIGKNFNITRERVRQIEGDAINSIRKEKKDETLSNLVGFVNDLIREKGSICSAENLKRETFQRYFRKANFEDFEARMLDIVFLVVGLKRIKTNREMVESWAAPDFDKKYFNEIVNLLDSIFAENKKILSTEAILKKIHYSEFSKKYPEPKPDHVVSFLGVSKKFGKNVFADWGKARWPLIRPRGVREKATLVLMKKSKPLHFRDISRMIAEFGLSQKKVHPQTVHNELIRDKRFVLVGRGTYALREWGYEEGTVKDVIISLIRSAGGFLGKERIIGEVLKKRKVKKATIAVNLADRKVFEKTSEGYKLKLS